MQIEKIVIHCSDSPPGRGDNAETIHRWHLSRGWDGIGYHYVIDEDGTVEAGRPHFWRGSHVRGHNAKSLGICLIGRGKDDFTMAQMGALRELVKDLRRQHQCETVCGHRDLDENKTCPGFDVAAWWDRNEWQS